MKDRKSLSRPDRRSFLGLSFASAGVGMLKWKHAHAQSSQRRKFKLGTVTYNLARDWSLDELIEMCERTGFDGVELRSTHRHGVEPDISDQKRAEVRQRFAATEVKLVCLGSACEFHSDDPSEVRENIELAKRFVDLAADVGAPGVKVRPNGIPETMTVDETLEQIAESLSEVGEHARTSGVGIWVEVHGRRTSHPPYIHRIMELCNDPLVGVTWNCNSADLQDGRVEPYFNLLQPYIRNVHIHDLYEEYPYATVFRLLQETGYEGYTLAEIPEVEGNAERFMHYYRMAWEYLSSDVT